MHSLLVVVVSGVLGLAKACSENVGDLCAGASCTLTSDCAEGRCFEGLCKGTGKLTWYYILIICIGSLIIVSVFIYCMSKQYKRNAMKRNLDLRGEQGDLSHLIIDPSKLNQSGYNYQYSKTSRNDDQSDELRNTQV